MNESLILDILQNTAVLLVFSMLYDYSWIKTETPKSIFAKILIGLIIGLIGIILMLTPWTLIPGIVFDTRSIMLSVSGLFFGAVPTLIAILITGLYRFSMGGDGIWMGIAVIIISGSIGILWRKLRPSWMHKNYIFELLIIGLIVHILMLGCTVLLPPDKVIPTLRTIAIPVIVIYPLVTMLLGVFMLKQYRNWQNRKAKEKLIESERRFTELLKNVKLLSVILDNKNTIMFCNQYLLDVTGYSQDELIGKNWFDTLVAPKDREELNSVFDNIINQQNTSNHIESEIIAKDGSKLIVSWNNTVLRSENHEIIGTASIGENITLRKKAEEEKMQFANILEASLNEIYIFDANTLKFKYVNFGALKNLGYTRAKILSMTLLDLTPDITLDEFNKIILPLRKHERSIVVFQSKHKRLNSTFYPAEVHMQLFEYLNESVFLAVIQDITARKKYENQLIKAKEKAEESDRLKSAFLTNMSHEIRTPMNGILGFTDLVAREDISTEMRSKYSEIIKSSTDRLLQLLTDIIDFSKIEAGAVELNNQLFNLNTMLSDIIYQKNITLQKDNTKSIDLKLIKNQNNNKIYILSDELRLKQVLFNLLDNAIKFTKEGFIEVGYSFINDQTLKIYIKDTGIGIKKENIGMIFERFRQEDDSAIRKYQGAGLGLSIAKGIVNVLGGEIHVESEIDKGSIFSFTVKVQKFEEEFPDESGSKIITPFSGKILIVEDELLNRLLFEELFKDNNVKLKFAETGEDAIKIMETDTDILVVLMDIKLPDISGVEAARRIKQINPDTLIIAQTAYAMDGDRERFLAKGFNDYMAKPINGDILFSKLNNLLKNF